MNERSKTVIIRDLSSAHRAAKVRNDCSAHCDFCGARYLHEINSVFPELPPYLANAIHTHGASAVVAENEVDRAVARRAVDHRLVQRREVIHVDGLAVQFALDIVWSRREEF